MKPIINLDDRRFDDLVDEARARVLNGLPELTHIVPGDPVHAFIDLFAWLGETVIYRANLIPERQRQAFLNLLQMPRRPATPARGLVCIDAVRSRTPNLPSLVRAESALSAGSIGFSTLGDLQPTPLSLDIVAKTIVTDQALLEAGITPEQLRATSPAGSAAIAFRPQHRVPGRDALDLGATVDQALYLAFSLPLPLVAEKDAVRKNLAGTIINLGIAPEDAAAADRESETLPRRLQWELAWHQDGRTDFDYLPLEVVADSSSGGRQLGVVRLKLPKDHRLLVPHLADDPANAGLRNSPPEQPGSVKPEQMLFWLRLSCPDEPKLRLGYLAVNAVEVIGQGVERDVLLGAGTGQPDQSLRFAHRDIDPASLQIDVEEAGRFQIWRQVEHFAASDADDRVYWLDAAEGLIRFGDGFRGKTPARGARIRAAYYRHGGGNDGNLPAGSIKSLRNAAPGLQLRHEWPTNGGVAAETVAQMEQRIPAFLSHRDRAVTADDFVRLCLDNPVNPVAKAELIPGLLPGSSLATLRTNVPGVVSVFVLPPAEPAFAGFPRTTAGLLKDVYGYLSARALLGTELYVLSPEYVAVAIAVTLQEEDPQTRLQVYQAVEAACLNFLWPLAPGGRHGDGWRMGQGVNVNECRTVASRVAGVRSIGELHVYAKSAEQSWQLLQEGQTLALKPWQLPELVAVSVQPEGNGEAPKPPPVVNGEAERERTQDWIPTPVIPDIC